jgi:ferredoxin
VTAERYRVRVDGEKCQGHNRCYALAPELFDIDDLGMSSARGDGKVTPELLDKARLAVANCPEYAVTLTELSDVSESAHPHDPAEVQP